MYPNKSRNMWIDAWNDPLAHINCYKLITSDLFNDGDWHLSIIDKDLISGSTTLKVWRNTVMAYEQEIHDKSHFITSFYFETDQVPAIAIATNVSVYIYTELNPNIKVNHINYMSLFI